MLGTELSVELFHAVKTSGAKLVLVGDDRQLSSADRGGAFEMLLDRYESAELKDVRRQTISWQKAVSEDLSRGDVKSASSHYPLRVVIKGWNYFNGVIFSSPYILLGIEVLNTKGWLPPWPLWAKFTCLIPFGLADVLNNSMALDDSNLAILNGFDSAMSYCYAFEGYKRDKLIRMTRQLRKLFKELRPEVLEEVDSELNKTPEKLQFNDSDEG